MSLIKQVSVWLLRLFSSSTLDMRVRAVTPDVERDITTARLRATYEMMPAAMIQQMIAAQGVYWILSSRVPTLELFIWLMARQAISAVRLGHASMRLAGYKTPHPNDLPGFLFLAMADGFLWGMLGWWFTPLFNLEVAVITISTLIGVASLGALMLHVNMAMSCAFIVPATVPAAFYSAGRGDDLGYFCFAAIMGLTGMLLLEASRSNRRIIEMLRLRFESEQANVAKTEALQQARLLAETKSRFVATMSHEMRTPLHGILGLVRLVKEDVQDLRNGKVNRKLSLIQKSGEHLVNVVNDVLDFSKSEAGSMNVHNQAFGLHEMLTEMTETCHVHCVEKGLTLDVMLAVQPEEWVLGDPVRIRQVLHNLLGNAIKFTARGEVGLRVWRDPVKQRMVFEVRDTGIGIAPKELPRVFDAFHQAEGTYERRFGGTGLGLTISRDLCRAMGGELRCDSEVGKGSVFMCELPLPCADASGQAASIGSGAGAKAGAIGFTQSDFAASDFPASDFPGWDFASDQDTPPSSAWTKLDIALGDAPHILLVEDNPVNAMVAQAELDRLGMRVTLVDNGFDAIEWLERESADLVLMDCEMPVMDGIETTRRIRERERQTGRPAVGIIALTANGQEVFIERCQPAGMNDHLLKPFKPEELADMLSRHLQHMHIDLCVSH
jgi:signal transduction histidine kinase/ActR/RegA family two-component response regulator